MQIPKKSVYEDADVRDRTIRTHRELIERDQKRAADRLVQSVLRSRSATLAVTGESE